VKSFFSQLGLLPFLLTQNSSHREENTHENLDLLHQNSAIAGNHTHTPQHCNVLGGPAERSERRMEE
jgi:hypothetical protein